MPNTVLEGSTGDALRERVSKLDETILPRAERLRALERFHATASGREKPGRYWRIDLDALELPERGELANARPAEFENVPPRAIACDLHTAAIEHPELFAKAFGRVVDDGKYASLARAFAGGGAFLYLPRGLAADTPIVVRYTQAHFPYTVILAEPGSQVTILERLDGDRPFTYGVAEILAEDGAHVTYAALQNVSAAGEIVMTRAARCERNATIVWASAELGGALSVSSIETRLAGEGSHAKITALFFPNDDQHVDLVTSVHHDVGHATSETLVKSAATGRGQGRYLGVIRIAHDAQGSDARLKDDALLLSEGAHIDSVPALEIAANDVKAFHGATVGAIDVEQIFYAETRGIARDDAEKMIALGFFEPAIERFPTEELRSSIRDALAKKIA